MGSKEKKKIILYGSIIIGVIIAGLLKPYFTNIEEIPAVVIDKSNMVKIPDGSFRMGSVGGYFDELPIHEVTMSSFLADIHEVTYVEFKKFLNEDPAWEKGAVDIELADLDYLRDWENKEFPQGKEDHPVVYISWYAAKAYAEWIGKKLPTEAQWEYASRGGLKGMAYTWGNEFSPHLLHWKGSNAVEGKCVGSYTINGYGLLDMLGNVMEWTADGYEIYYDLAETDPVPRINHHLKVARGGSWKSPEDELTVSARRKIKPVSCLPDLGFRLIS